MDRSIIHLNVADFAVAVERIVDIRLNGRPVLIAPEAASRAVVYDMSEEAYKCGVRKGMPLRGARRICKDARVLPPHTDRYERAMKSLIKQALPYSPLIETGEDDGHLFVDVTGAHRLFGPPMDVAWRLRRDIKADLRLNPVWSVAPNKLVAKVATRLVKPFGEYIVSAGEEEAFLAPLPVGLVPGLEPADMQRLKEFNLDRVSQVTALGPAHLETPFGPRARYLYDIMRGIDLSPVLPIGQKQPKIVADCYFGDDTNDAAILEGVLYGLVEEIGRKLRRQRQAARHIMILIGYTDGRRCTRQVSLDLATANDLSLFEASRSVFLRAWTRRVRVRHIRLIGDRLVFPPAQLELFPDLQKTNEKHENLIATIDNIRSRFGKNVIHMGRTIAAQAACSQRQLA